MPSGKWAATVGDGFWGKNYCGQGALQLRDGFQKDFRLIPEETWLAARMFERGNP